MVCDPLKKYSRPQPLFQVLYDAVGDEGVKRDFPLHSKSRYFSFSSLAEEGVQGILGLPPLEGEADLLACAIRWVARGESVIYFRRNGTQREKRSGDSTLEALKDDTGRAAALVKRIRFRNFPTHLQGRIRAMVDQWRSEKYRANEEVGRWLPKQRGRLAVFGWRASRTGREPTKIICHEFSGTTFRVAENQIFDSKGTFYRSCLVVREDKISVRSGITMAGSKPLFFYHEDPPFDWYGPPSVAKCPTEERDAHQEIESPPQPKPERWGGVLYQKEYSLTLKLGSAYVELRTGIQGWGTKRFWRKCASTTAFKKRPYATTFSRVLT